LGPPPVVAFTRLRQAVTATGRGACRRGDLMSRVFGVSDYPRHAGDSGRGAGYPRKPFRASLFASCWACSSLSLSRRSWWAPPSPRIGMSRLSGARGSGFGSCSSPSSRWLGWLGWPYSLRARCGPSSSCSRHWWSTLPRCSADPDRQPVRVRAADTGGPGLTNRPRRPMLHAMGAFR
jgi:hypothetical protein